VLGVKSRVSSTVTKRKTNPRPRKYASASERQAAYRARAPEMCFRAEDKTVDTLDRIAADLDVSRADLLLSMTKFALTNHDWARFGLTHKPLPFGYGTQADETRKENPTMKTTTKRKPTPAQLAARERFAEMARSGASRRKANPAKRTGYRITVFDDDNQPVSSTFDTEEQGALLYAKGMADANKAGEIRHVLSKSQKLVYWFDGSGIHRAGTYGDKPFYTTRRAALRSNPAKPAASRRVNPVKPTAAQRFANPSTVYQVQNSKDGKVWEVWGTYMYLAMAKDVANRRAAEAPREFVRVESIKVKS